MEAGIWPIPYPFDPTVFDWVPMDVIRVLLEIPIIADHVFPIPALPDAAFASFCAAFGALFTR